MSTPQNAQSRTPGGEAFRRALAEAAPPLGAGTVITIGVFDGVHRGHRHLLHRMLELAEPPLVPTVITFSNHPAEVVNPERTVSKIITPEEKVDLLYDAGVGCVICVSSPTNSQILTPTNLRICWWIACTCGAS